jgi:nucleotide-binding universal stress UspA family protein
MVIAIDEPITPNVVGQIIPPIVKWTEEVNQTYREWVSKVLIESVDTLQAAGLEASSLIYDGNPKKELVRQAEEWDAECIFVGSIGFHNALERFLLGSVSAAVAARAHCSVEVVRLIKKKK